ncbi:MAG: septal ring lytic transglycosylase RlpA family protein [bacterium]|nr:septal ring lytic transglycosylase RlpA family protein [bacterium]
MKRIIFLLLLLLAFSFFLAGCLEDPEEDEDLIKEFYQEGEASWYGEDFHGKKTANGEIYNMYAFTAAHKTLPFNTRVLVVNQNNKKKVIVRINDRGPYVGERIIDLSYAAADKIGMTNSGVAPVKLFIIKETSGDKEAKYFIQLGAFEKRQNAIKLREKVSKHTKNVHIIERAGKYKVLVGPFNNENDAQTVLNSIKNKAKINGFITREYYPF